ncbi:MAG TPA: Swt1 family HEPN domain-containing protein [Acidimicrobiales bacterium]
MTTSYRPQVAAAFEVLADGLAPFVDRRMAAITPGDDWILVAAEKLGKRRDVLVSLVDPHFQLEVIVRWWGPAFDDDLPESMRPVVTDLRTARNHWAHPDPDHPFDLEYALQVHRWAEELLVEAGATEQARRVAELGEELRWAGVDAQARQSGQPETEVLFDELVRLEAEQDLLTSQLQEARELASSATGRSRALSRQLAELQAQYAAVAGLREEYLDLQRQLDSERTVRDSEEHDTSDLHQRLVTTAEAAARLHAEGEQLRAELERTRAELSGVDPMHTEIGRRWMWLVAGLILLLGVLIVLVGYQVR